MNYGSTVPYVLPQQAYSAGSNTTQTLRDLPKQLFGRLCHLAKFTFFVTLTPTFSVANTVFGNNNVFTGCDFWDGSMYRFQGGMNFLRYREIIQTGRLRQADAALNASTNARYFARTLHAGPPQFLGAPSDFAIPNGVLENGELRFKHGALSDIQQNGGTVSAATATVKVVASLLLMDEIRIPPAYQFVNQQVNAADFNMAGRALYESLTVVVDGNGSTFSAGDLGNIRVDLGAGDIVAVVDRGVLYTQWLDDFAGGELVPVQGDPQSAANDINQKTVNQTSGTAVRNADQTMAPVLWSPPDARISKLFLAESVCRARWDGGRTSAIMLISRILSQPPAVAGAMAGKAIGRLPLSSKGNKIKTLSKMKYNGPYTEFMPWAVKV